MGSRNRPKICIVSYGGIFPDARNPSELFTNLLASKVSIRNFLDDKTLNLNQPLDFFFSKDPKAPNRTTSLYGAGIDRNLIREICKERGLDFESLTNTQIVAIEAASQALKEIYPRITNERLDYIIGCTAVDNEGSLLKEQRHLAEKFGKKVPLLPDKETVDPKYYEAATSLLKGIRDHFPNKGISFLTDAACASSFASVYCGMNRLLSDCADFALVGGVELNYSPFLQVMFSKAGVLSPEPLRPFDRLARGINPSEAAVLFLLTTEEKANEFALPILAVIEECEGSSDGLKGGNTEPTLEGQLLAYERVHGKNDRRVDFIEAHGTGTIVGDKTEIESLSHFFPSEIPIGSVKANLGHTIAAAGACSLAKTLKIFQEKRFPGLPLFHELPHGSMTKLRFTPHPIPLPDRPLRAALSSFGFGGTNFHLAVAEGNQLAQARELPSGNVYLVACHSLSFNALSEALEVTMLRIPPVSLPSIDRNVLGGILGLERLLIQEGIYLDAKARQDVHVLSAGSLTLELANSLAEELRKEHAAFIAGEKSFKIDRHFSSDTSSGILNNLISGRAAKVFDFRGVNFHIDADLGSRFVALQVARDILQKRDGAVVVISTDEEFSETDNRFTRTGVRIELLATEKFIFENDLPCAGGLQVVNHHG
jgi:acyl transferase domain-containing protein